MLAAGERVSVTTDEYTSTQNKRYSAVSLHHRKGRPIKIGMIRIHGSLPGIKAALALKKRLNEYGINEDKHLVANTTDGAAMMKVMGREFLASHQICHSHGIHLAGKNILKIFYSHVLCWRDFFEKNLVTISVCEVIYKKKKGKGRKKKTAATKNRPPQKSAPGLSGQQIRAALNADKDSSDGTSSEEEVTDTEEIIAPLVDKEKESGDESEDDDSDIQVRYST